MKGIETMNGVDTGREALLVAHMPLAEKIAWQLYRQFSQPHVLDLDEMKAQSFLEMTELWERYDAQRGVTFGAFLQVALRWNLLAYCRRMLAKAGHGTFLLVRFSDIDFQQEDGSSVVLEFADPEDFLEAVETLVEFRRFYATRSPKDQLLLRLRLAGYSSEECVAFVNERYAKARPRSKAYVAARLRVLRVFYHEQVAA